MLPIDITALNNKNGFCCRRMKPKEIVYSLMQKVIIHFTEQKTFELRMKQSGLI